MNFLSTWDYPDPPLVTDGVLDLRNVELNSRQTFELNGEWKFYPGIFLMATSSNPTVETPTAQEQTIRVPQAWDGETASQGSEFQYGSYRLQILLNPDNTQTLGIRFSWVGNASAVFINGQLAGSSGHPSTTEVEHRGGNLPYSVAIPPDSKQLDIVVHVSSDQGVGGIYKPVRFGTFEAIQSREALLVGLQLLLCVIALFNSLYALILYGLGARHQSIGYFLAIMTLMALSTLISDDKLLFQWIEIPYDWQTKLVRATYLGMVAFLPLVASHLFPSRIGSRLAKTFAILCALYLLFVTMAPHSVVESISPLLVFSFDFFASVAITSYLLIREVHRDEGVLFLLFTCIAVAVNMIWSVAMLMTPSWEQIHYPFDLIIAILSFSAFWFHRFFRETERSLRLACSCQSKSRPVCSSKSRPVWHADVGRWLVAPKGSLRSFSPLLPPGGGFP